MGRERAQGFCLLIGRIMATSPSDRWHIDKGIPISLIVLVIAQTVYVTNRITTTENKTYANTEAIQKLENARLAERASERIGVVESQISSVANTINKIDNKVDDIQRLLVKRQ